MGININIYSMLLNRMMASAVLAAVALGSTNTATKGKNKCWLSMPGGCSKGLNKKYDTKKTWFSSIRWSSWRPSKRYCKRRMGLFARHCKNKKTIMCYKEKASQCPGGGNAKKAREEALKKAHKAHSNALKAHTGNVTHAKKTLKALNAAKAKKGDSKNIQRLRDLVAAAGKKVEEYK